MIKKILAFVVLVLLLGCEKKHELPASPGRMIKDFKLETGQYGNATIYQEEEVFKILVRVLPETDLKKVVPIITLSDGAQCNIASGEPIDVSATSKVVFTVTAASGDVRNWEVEFRVYDSSISDYGTYSIAVNDGSAVMQIQGDMSFNEKYLENALVQVAAAEAATGENLKRWQEWDIIYHSSVGDTKYYQLRNLQSGMFLSGVSSGVQLKQNWEAAGDIDLQLWRIDESLQAGKFELSNKANGLYLTLGADDAVLAQGSQEQDSQRWAITRLPKDSYRDAQVTNFFNRTTGSVAFDQGTSIPLSDGRALWITQDAWYEGSMAPNGNLFGNHFISYSNSIIIQPSIDNWNPNAPMMTADGRVHNIGNIVPKREGKDWSWPGPGVQIGQTVYLHATEGNALGSPDDNQALFKLTPVSDTHWNVERTTPVGLTASEKLITYAAGMVKAADGFVYAYGARGDPNSFGFGSFLHVARFPIENPQDWTFWNGSSWEGTASVAEQAQVNSALGTSSVGYLNGKYIHLTMDQGFYCGIPSINMYTSTSSSPTGPFSERRLVYHFTEFYKGYNARIYTPSIHTESVNGRDELLVTYSINYGACAENDADKTKEDDGNFDPYYYRVKGVRIPYEMIGIL